MAQSPEAVREFFRSHWTVRKYKAVSMPSEHLDVILYAAQRAPTDATAQMYSIVRLTDKALREKIAKLSGNPHVATASEAFIVCGDLHRLDAIFKAEGTRLGAIPAISLHFAIGDAVMAGENMLLAAEMLGYRGCWIGGVMNALQEISELIQLPPKVFPFAALTLGVPDESPQYRPRLPREQVIHENTYRAPSASALAQGVADMAAISGRGSWALKLAGYFAQGGSMETREVALQKFLAERYQLG
ncbi:MAG: nitroreductase family protein [Bdellovibrionales bacterium]|nr:nitroreductase family protein [Bdellovibrionales bacterium]